MNIAQTKQIDIVDFLKAIGCFPYKGNRLCGMVPCPV